MGLFSTVEAKSLEDLLSHHLKDLYDAEHLILEALPKMIETAQYPALKEALENHRVETEGQVKRLEECFERMDMEPERESCAGMKGIIAEGEKMMKGDMTPELKDVAIIEAAQKVEHYEISCYGTARAIAMELGQAEIADLLNQNLQEEGKADQLLTEIATKDVNPSAK